VTAAATIALLWIGFSATHLGLASVRVEPRLRRALGDAGFLGLYSAVAFAFFVPLVWVYFGNRHAGTWWWAVPVGPVLRAAFYAVAFVATTLVVVATVRPSPAALGGAERPVTGIYRITRHPTVLGLGLLMALHLVPFGASTDVAFFGGFVAFTLLGAWHQDRRKLHAGAPGFRAFYEATPFLPFAGPGVLRGLREIPRWGWAAAAALFVAIRWVHGSLWPSP
jgi:uncharacterized membrane protein